MYLEEFAMAGVWCVLPALLSLASKPDERFIAMVGGYGPRTEVRYAKPTLAWQIWAGNSKAAVSDVRMKLDGVPVAAEYEPRSRSVRYTPIKPLSAGKHRVECRVTFENGFHFDQTWDTTVADAPLNELPGPTPDQETALSEANRLRKLVGLEPMVHDPRMNMAALGHSLYLVRNRATGHGESPGTPGYLARNGGERLEAYGWVGGSWEGVNFGGEDVPTSVRELFDAPYHRIPFLQPGPLPFGSGFSEKSLTIEFGDTVREETVASPADGQTGIPTSWHNFESPDPVRVHGAEARLTGYPVVLARFGREKLQVSSARMLDPNGDVPCWLNTPANDPSLTSAAILIPQAPLRAGTVYQVIWETSGGEVVTRFRTAEPPAAPQPKRKKG